MSASSVGRWRQVLSGRHTAALAGAILSAACSSGMEVPLVSPQGLSCVDDSKPCIDQRMATLKVMMADRDRRWVHEPATPHAYASGVRLFAFKGRKKELTCAELAVGKREADAGQAVLRGPSATGLSPAQIARGTMLSAEVSRELGVEMKRRCRA